MAGREHLDNLTMVVNCNLQRLDGPVRGNGKVIQEFEATLRGAGWNVIKVVWGRTWDELLARDVDGVLLARMNETVDGEFQKYATESGAYIREHFFGPDPRLPRAGRAPERRRAAEPPPWRPRLPQALRRLPGGHRARRGAHGHPGQDRQGLDARPRDRGPQRHPPDQEDDQGPAARPARPAVPPRGDRRGRPRRRPPPVLPARRRTRRPGEYLAERRRALGGPAPQPGGAGPAAAGPRPADLRRPARPAPDARRSRPPWPSPACSGRSTRDPGVGRRIVPIVSDEARTFGLESLISEVQIYAPDGQRYTPVDAGLALHYAESASGPDPGGGDHRGRGDRHLHRGRHLVRHLGRVADPLLPLLFDVRVPAGGRPAVGPRRQPGPGLPPRLHRRADHPQRRGAPAPGRPLAPARLAYPSVAGLRPGVRLRGGGDHGGRDPADDRARTPRTATGT